MKQTNEFKHTRDFFRKKRRELKKWAERWDKKHNTIEATAKFNFYFKTIDDFETFWESVESKDKLKGLKYNLIYEQRYNTAIAELRALKEAGVEDLPTLNQLKRMKHKTFIKRYGNLITDYWENLTLDGYKGRERNEMNSEHWFGSK